MASVELTRYRGVAIVALALVLALVLVDRAGAAIFGPRAAVLVPTMYIDWTRFDTFAGRVAAVERQRAHDPASFPSRWGVVLGHSSAEQDVDPIVLKAHSGGVAWLVLAGSGGSSGMDNLDFHFAELAKTSLRPKLVVLTLHPFMFAVGPEEPPPKVDLAKAIRARSPKDVFEAAKSATWLGATQSLFGELVGRRARAARAAIANFARWPNWATNSVEPKPWESNFTNLSGQQDPRRLRERIERSGELGRFDAANYVEGPVRAAERLFARIETLGAKTVVIVMPEHSAFRGRIPEIGMTRLRSGFPERVVVLDFRTAIPDSGFWDPYHLNRGGKQRFSEILGERLLASGVLP